MNEPGRSTWLLNIETEWINGLMVLALSGRIDKENAMPLARALEAEGSSGKVVVDMSGVDYISGPGLMVLSEAGEGRPIVICSLQEPVLIACELAGLTGTLSIAPDRQTAVARLA